MRKMTNALKKYFQEDCRYYSDCFRRFIYTHCTNIAKTPYILGEQLPFRRIFYLQRPQYQYLVNTSPVDQNFGECFSCPKAAPVPISSHLDTFRS